MNQSLPGAILYPAHAIIESCHEAIIGNTLEGTITIWNPAAEALYGYTAAEMMGRSFSFLNPPDQIDPFPQLLAKIGRDENVGLVETVQRHKEGKLIQVALTLSPVRDELGNITGASAIGHDVSDEKRREDEHQNQAKLAAEAADLAKTQFIANMSHEMRTPLAAILGYAEMMYDSRQTVTERLNCIGRIRHNLKSLTSLVDDILDLSKVEAGKTEICPVRFSFLPELGEILSPMESQAWKKRLHFDVRFEGNIPETVTIDPARFRQILNNVVGNAIKFTERGGVSITVKLVAAEKDAVGPRLAFVVSDTGCGIGPNQIDSLFQPFVQGDGSLTRSFGGAGLGLALARRLARNLGGDVVLTETQPGRGSQFTITIDPGPLETARMLDSVSRDQLLVRQPPPPPGSVAALNGMRVLLVEDAPDIQILVRHFLKRSGVHVEVADNGQDGIKKAKSERYDLILMDIQMPVLNGYEATAQLHREGFNRPIVALTAHAMKGMREKCLEAGCDDYLTKPINASALLDLIGRYYRRGRGMATH